MRFLGAAFAVLFCAASVFSGPWGGVWGSGSSDAGALADLSDVDMSPPPDSGSLIRYNGTVWVPTTFSITDTGANFGLETGEDVTMAFAANGTGNIQLDTTGGDILLDTNGGTIYLGGGDVTVSNGILNAQYMRATEPTADTNPVKFGWTSPDVTLYGLELRGASGTRPYSVGLVTEGTTRLWANFLGSNYVTGPHRFTGNIHTTARVGITNYTLATVDAVYAVVDSDYTLPAINTAGIYQGDGDGAAVGRTYTVVRGNSTNPVALIATGTDVIEIQGSEVSGGAVTLSWLSTDSIDFTEKGAGARCQETYYRVSTGPDVFKAAWMCAPIGLGIEASP